MSALALHPLEPLKRILDLGCGTGLTITKLGWKLEANDVVVGVDVRQSALVSARKACPYRPFLSARGESLPFRDKSFDVVLCNVALPYMDIPKALAEAARVLAPGGALHLKVHTFLFSVTELRKAFPHPGNVVFRCYVLANGLLFHLNGTTPLHFLGHVESFQTERGLRKSLERAGFVDLRFRKPEGKLLVEARKPVQ
jgi:ubiquinone/menaquinone biosynthesis C-methylase UbiE